ncbi:MAG: hypothetical protein Q4D29_07515 [Lachnospiraceae bacterium]|nr:hypothetical protein [Lachnospiraceae bacterium]
MNALIILFYRIVTFFTRVPDKTRALHTLSRAEKLSKITANETGFINFQSKLTDIPYGKGDLGLNGCGPIALYNAILSLCESDYENTLVMSQCSFSSIVDYLELKGAAFKGKLGTAPTIINRYLVLRGYTTEFCTSKKESKLNEFSDKFDAFISLIYNDSHSLKKGLHFICTRKNIYGGFTSHNPERTSDNLYKTLNMCSKDEIRHVCTIGIKK